MGKPFEVERGMGMRAQDDRRIGAVPERQRTRRLEIIGHRRAAASGHSIGFASTVMTRDPFFN